MGVTGPLVLLLKMPFGDLGDISDVMSVFLFTSSITSHVLRIAVGMLWVCFEYLVLLKNLLVSHLY